MASEKKPNHLNYKYEIFPTKPQRVQLNRILRESRIQWNKAVTIRNKLKAALRSGQIEHVVNTYLSYGKDNNQGKRKKSILEFQASRPEHSSLDFNSVAKLYTLKNLVGEDLEPKHADTNLLIEELEGKYKKELAEWGKAKADGIGNKNLPKRRIFWQLWNAIGDCAGYAAKICMDRSFESPKDMAIGSTRPYVSGYKESKAWNTAIKPKKKQRAYGARGEPQYKKRGGSESFAYQETDPASKLIRKRKNGDGYLININTLSDGMRWVPMAYHRPIPDGTKIKQLRVKAKARRFFAVFSCEVPDSTWQIAPMNAGWHAGIDPGASTALSAVALKNSKTGELAHFSAHWEFLDKGLDKLEKMQQALAHKQGPKRKMTKAEIEKALKNRADKNDIKKLLPEEQEKELSKLKKNFETRMVRNENGPSRGWKELTRKISYIHMKIANQRADVHHKMSRALAEGCDVVGVGDWEPPRTVSYRSARKLLRKKVRMGIAGAAEELKALEEKKSKQGPKGIKKIRRGGRDRGIATFRSLLVEKAGRAGILAIPKVNEKYSTMTCCVCHEQTGPKGNVSIREWRCEKCDTTHHRDLNGGYNILEKTELEIAAAAQATAAPETGQTAARTTAQGCDASAGRGDSSGLRATGRECETQGGNSQRGGSFFYGHAYETRPNLWDGDVPKALKSLIRMGIVRSLTLEKGAETGPGSPS